MSFQPLAGVRVVDLTSSVAGPTCTELLAALGADVVKVENPQSGDESRTWGPSFWQDATPIFFAVNSSKRSLALDLKSDRGREIVLQLADRADVVIQSMRPGTAERLGLGAETLRARNERLVYASISAWGTEGPLAPLPGYDPLLQSFTGIVSVTGESDRPGQRVGVALIDIGTGMWCGLAIVSALLERTQTGRGRTVDAALFDTAVGYLDYLYTDFLGTGRVPEPTGTQSPIIAPNEAFETADGRLMVCALNDRLFARFCAALELPELVEDPRFRTNLDRIENRDALLAPIREKLAAQPNDHWLEVLEGIPVAPIQDVPTAATDEHTRASGMLQEIEGVETVRTPLRIDGERLPHRSPPPRLGEHTADVLAELGYSDEEIDELAASGAVAVASAAGQLPAR